NKSGSTNCCQRCQILKKRKISLQGLQGNPAMILMETSMNSVFIDPRTKYPKPEFSSKPQPIPGSEKEMSPQADHGENSYQGNNRLNGAVAIITGGDSGIGRAIAVAYAHEGAHVAFTYLEEDKDAQETERLIKECGV